MKLAKLTDPSEKKIAGLHLSAQKKAAQAVRDALTCGHLLLAKKEKLDHGQWLPFLDRVGISADTALRYMAASERWQIEGRGDAKSLMDLYRAYGILPELAGGGRRAPAHVNGASGQIYFDFDLFDGFMRVIDHRTDNPFLGADRAGLIESRRCTVKALELMDEALKKQPK
jgi:hypothetical protein